MEQITKQKAIELGYTHFCEEGGDALLKLSDVIDENKSEFKNVKCFLVDMENPNHYKITAEVIRDLVSDYIGDDDEIADEDEKLYVIAHSHDYSKVAEELNEKFKAIDYFYPLDIEVTFNE